MQKYSSRDTSVPQVSRAITEYDKRFGFRKRSTVLDYGGGRYDLAIDYAKNHGFNLYVYDPFWRTDAYNKKSLMMFTKSPDYIVCANVLNVIKEDAIVEDVVRKIRKLAKKETTVIFVIYERNKDGIGTATAKGWQRNQSMDDYLPLLRAYFPHIYKKYGMFIATI